MFRKKSAIMLVTLMTATAAFVSGCGTSSTNAGSAAQSSSPAKETAGSKQPVEFNFYFTGSQNVKDLWDTLIPMFEKQNADIKVKPVYIPSGTGAQPTYDRITAAKQANKGSGDIDLYEDGLSYVTRGQKDDLWAALPADKIKNLASVDEKTLKDISNMAIPYRSSAVVLAYNSDKVKTPPTTLDELYDWIKKNPDRFAYNDPSTGGAGNSFVATALYKFLPEEAIHNSDPSVEKGWDQGFALLKELGKSVYGKGIYPKKNQGTLDLLTSGEVDMIPAWSDMVLEQVAKGQLPKTTKMAQITPGFNGGPTYLMVPKLSEKKDAVYKFLDFVLSPEAQGVVVDKMHGFPGIKLSSMSKEIQDSFKGASEGFRSFNIGELDKDMTKRWQSDVAAQ
ncbi:extracellular solute-binding protein [Paenibacillus aceris]|uniref:Spermidine/putrescine transport system substrate-binding protein n=1 Tax=Paenibacillus aceris TaxID=869555 RepID=A0ABS4HZQ5_9BACL|nr:extracellular solute-binding protein [Paenibacillus aceris]MBP1964156.1 putative spermidine/putrescine transport system substrate-binding protein [Paenibacillus aceris]NHW36486.1 extracellular solute-binding protein [Paenibacillus aceris]